MNSQLSDDAINNSIRLKARTEYSSPKLLEYGALSEITLTVGQNGLKDSGGPTSSNKTHL